LVVESANLCNMKTKNAILVLTTVMFLFLTNTITAQANYIGNTNYTFATSTSANGKIIYVSTIFCWTCSADYPCNGVLYGKNTTTPCDFLQSWALTTFKDKQKGFDGKDAIVPCVAESLTMYDFANKDSISTKRNIVIADYKKQHKTVVIVTFPACKDK
jgi:hypothetical protein